MKQKGFTLIELLVVIAVIGMLASIVLVSLGPARAKARDARRIADVRQMSTALEIEATSNNAAIAVDGCTGDNVDASTCSGPGALDFTNFKDPSTSTTPLCTTTDVTCQYSISTKAGASGAKLDDYQICFKLEQGAGTLAAGVHSIETNGVIVAGCS